MPLPDVWVGKGSWRHPGKSVTTEAAFREFTLRLLRKFKKPVFGDASHSGWFLYSFVQETPLFASWPHLVQLSGRLMADEITFF